MKNFQSLIIIFVFLYSGQSLLLAQGEPNGCGSICGRSEWLKEFQLRPDQDKSDYRTAELIQVPMSIHIVSSDDGKGGFGEKQLVSILCNLNKVFLDADIQFYMHDLIHESSSEMYNHSDVITGGKYMLSHNIPNTLNCYIVSDPASNCGYNLPWAGIAIAKSCAKTNDLTWAHEIGHALSLPHPFLGWEGGQTHDNTVPSNFFEPAPTYVTYNYTDFKQVMYEDTLIIDTSIVELVDRSNCLIAGDGFCDTEPDYIASRWNCNNVGQSNSSQLDPSGALFYSRGEYLMGYSSANILESNTCTGIFTADQQVAMRANLLEQKADWLDDSIVDIDGVNSVINLSPTDKELVDFKNVTLTWDVDDGIVDRFLIQIGRNAAMTSIIADTIVVGHELVYHDLKVNKTYYWNVKPFDNNEFCADFSDSHGFKTADLSLVNELTASSSSISPTILSQSDILNIDFDLNITAFRYKIFDIGGRVIRASQQTNNNKVVVDQLSTGTYFINIITATENSVFKFVVQ